MKLSKGFYHLGIQFTLIILGYFFVATILSITPLVHDVWKFYSIVIYFGIINFLLVLTLIYFFIRNVRNHKYNLLQTITYFIFGSILLASFSFLLNEYFNGNVLNNIYDYYVSMQSHVIVGKIFLVLALI